MYFLGLFAATGRVLGGKGGFGSTLRSQGNRMNSKPNTFDDCRDLYGRRLRTLKEAKTIVEKFEQEDKAREEAAERRRKKIADGLQEKPVKKYRFDDTEHTRNCEEIVESTKKTTRTALRKKLAKNKKTMDSESDSLASSSPSNASDSAELAGKAPLIPLFDGELSSSSDEDEGDDDDKSDEK
ncbi:hypothetical protein GGF43_002283 [Coemansia sp. RSA 2618]|nr:hypothetical protein GGF43_002283 [Coemansia sp. RSA 2618]